MPNLILTLGLPRQKSESDFIFQYLRGLPLKPKLAWKTDIFIFIKKPFFKNNDPFKHHVKDKLKGIFDCPQIRLLDNMIMKNVLLTN